jgi:hypothetical protein
MINLILTTITIIVVIGLAIAAAAGAVYVMNYVKGYDK